MSQVDQNSLKNWQDKDVISASQYDNERNLLVTAINDNATKLGDMYTKEQVDAKVATMATTITIASGTTFPSSPTTEQLFYRTDLNAMYEYDNVLGWHLNHKAGTGITVGADGTISLAGGSSSTPGALQVGEGLNVSNSIVSARDLLWAVHMGIGGF